MKRIKRTAVSAVSNAKSIEWYMDGQAFSLSYELAPGPR